MVQRPVFRIRKISSSQRRLLNHSHRLFVRLSDLFAPIGTGSRLSQITSRHAFEGDVEGLIDLRSLPFHNAAVNWDPTLRQDDTEAQKRVEIAIKSHNMLRLCLTLTGDRNGGTFNATNVTVKTIYDCQRSDLV